MIKVSGYERLKRLGPRCSSENGINKGMFVVVDRTQKVLGVDEGFISVLQRWRRAVCQEACFFTVDIPVSSGL